MRMPCSSARLFIAPAILIAAAGAGCSAQPASEMLPPQPNRAELSGSAANEAKTGAPAAEPVDAEGPALAVEGEGLRWFLQPNGSARPLPFGIAEGDLLNSLERQRGPASRGTNFDCGAGRVQFATWPDGLSLLFQDRRFVGWGLDARAAGKLATAAGIGPGSTRTELEAAYSASFTTSSLGTEFSAGELHGLLDGQSKDALITDMWAGTSCAAR